MRPKSHLASFSEKRSLYRARRSRPAHCVFNEGATVIDVVLRDISPAGARIGGAEVAGLPQTFELRSTGFKATRNLQINSNAYC
jgi:hypothetical protein